MVNAHLKKRLLPAWEFFYSLTLVLCFPLNCALAWLLRKRAVPGSVLHISHMVHVPFYIREALRKHKIKADYMAIGESFIWDKSDYCLRYSKLPFVRLAQEMFWVWGVACRYEIIHSHFMLTASYSGWELPFFKWMGRKLVVNYRGCDIRDRELNIRLHPEINICQECDYFHPAENKFTCQLRRIHRKRRLMQRYGDAFLVTTPDLKEFVPQAVYFPFFTPELNGDWLPRRNEQPARKDRLLKIVHATNHPGIEGTEKIRAVIDSLNDRGFNIEFVFLRKQPHEKVLKELIGADLSIGKMKMGFYANAQIESMYLGVPAVTYVRPEYITKELKDSGFIFSSLDNLGDTLQHYLTRPQLLQAKKTIARESVIRLHNNEELSKKLITLYRGLSRNRP